MIKFFRKIRQKLLMENPPSKATERAGKFSKPSSPVGRYLIYALGEILLVVIGILIALQLNNWNQDRKEMNAEVQLYSKILKDLKTEYNSLDSEHIEYSKMYDDLHKHIYSEIKGIEQDNPNEYYNFLLWYHRFNMLFNQKYTEFLATITNEKINQKLKSYIAQEKTTFNAVDEFNEHQIQHVRSYLSKYGINNDEAMFTKNVNDFGTLINRTNLINYSKLRAQYGSEQLNQLLFNMRFKNLWMTQNFNWLQEQNREFQLILGQEMASTKLAGSFEKIEPKSIHELQILNKTDHEIVDIIRREVEDTVVYNFTESEVNSFGYKLMRAEKYQDALTVFKLNVELNPSWNTYDSYGELLMEIGEIKDGLKAYEKSLELNPENSNAKEIIERFKNGGQ